MAETSPDRNRRRWWKVLALCVIGIAALVAAFPRVLGTPPARRWLLARADRALAPGGLELATLRLSWFGPTRMTHFVLRDRQGDRVVVAARATWDRNLWQILFDRPRYGTLTLDDADLDIERLADGSVDLYEAIKPVLGRNPRTALTIRFEGGRLRFRSPGLPEPVQAACADLTLEVQAAPGPIAWRLRMRQGPGGEGREEGDLPVALEITGRYERWQVRPAGVPADLLVALAGRRWPWSLEHAGVVAAGTLDGDLAFGRRSGRWDLSGQARVAGLDASGPRLAGDHLRLDRLAASWDLVETDQGWSIRRLDLSSPLGSIRADGTLPAPPGRSARLVGTLDLAALARQLPHALHLGEEFTLDRGLASVQVEARTEADTPTWDVEARVSDLEARDRGRMIALRDPVTLSARLALRPDEWAVRRLTFASRYASLDASGRLSDLDGRRLIDLEGTLTPDWKALNDLLAERVEPNARLSGKPGPLRLKGTLGAGSTEELLGSLDGELGFDLVGADLYGMHVGPTPIVLRPREGRLHLDPIDTTLNEGRLHLEPLLTLDDDHGAAVRLGPASSIRDAHINDEVSHRVLSFVAPVLDRATRVNGRVSVALDEAVFPLDVDPDRGVTVEGEVVFQDVAFVPGPLGDQLFALLGREDRPSLRLDQPVSLTIADRRVHQRGLALPLGNVTRIELEGWVDFDRTLALTASLPVTPAMVGNRPVLSDIVAGTRISVPIRGTLDHPRVDRDAMNLALKDLGKTLLERGAVRGAAELLMRLGRGRDPDAPPPLTPEERRARRRERRTQRRLNRGLEP